MAGRSFGRAMRALSMLALAAGCTVGPDFKRPAAPAVKGYTQSPLEQTASADVRGGAAQRFAAGLDIPGQWWRLFHSPALDSLVKQALAANPDLAAAQAALRQAQETLYAGRGALYPQVIGNFNATRNKTAAILSPVPATSALYYSLYTAQLTVSYDPDVFGANKRTVESLAAQAEAQRFELDAAYLTLTSNVVAGAINEASLRGQIAATEEIIEVERESLDILRRQLSLGQVAGADVALQEAALAQAEASLPPLQKQLAQQRDQLAALVGGFPSAGPAEKFELSSLALPQDLPVSLPSRLVEQRPDIRAAEANLHSASAQIGVAIAAMLPDISLTANPGSTALTLGSLFSPGTGFWTLAGGVTQTIFDAGTLLHKKRAAVAAFDQTAAQYKSTVVSAFQNVADSLHALQSDADALKTAVDAEAAAKKSLDITRSQLALGDVDYLALLQAQQAYQQALVTLVQAQASRYADTAALFQALGGGWWNRHDVGKEAVTKP
jgi:NodT family efflux transporter outer membrane factor (OMF) lipoprotein